MVTKGGGMTDVTSVKTTVVTEGEDVTTTGVTLLINTGANLTIVTYIATTRQEYPPINTSNGGAIGQVHEVTSEGNHNEVGLESSMKEALLSYANKLSPTSLTKANLHKLNANVPKGVDFDIWLPLASVHERCEGGSKRGHGGYIDHGWQLQRSWVSVRDHGWRLRRSWVAATETMAMLRTLSGTRLRTLSEARLRTMSGTRLRTSTEVRLRTVIKVRLRTR
ncbi:hypothetical protein Tco_0685405 [Tanacetum coccineum]